MKWLNRAVSTHPDIAALITHLSASRIEGIFIPFFSFRRRRREAGPAKRRPCESALHPAISQQDLFYLFMRCYMRASSFRGAPPKTSIMSIEFIDMLNLETKYAGN